ncbi:hypothetical protein GGS20DRAFT_590584 [Poronia punctata]|nr:hypothetical protein GGS20DRAFT_590584 [Poronia punctata]
MHQIAEFYRRTVEFFERVTATDLEQEHVTTTLDRGDVERAIPSPLVADVGMTTMGTAQGNDRDKEARRSQAASHMANRVGNSSGSSSFVSNTGVLAPPAPSLGDYYEHQRVLCTKIDDLAADVQTLMELHNKPAKMSLEKDLEVMKDKLRGTTEQLELMTKKWKKVGSELSQLKAKEANNTQQLTDSDLVNFVKQLRHTIRSFIAQHCTVKAPRPPPPDSDFWKYVPEAVSAAESLGRDSDPCLVGGSEIVQAFIWRLLLGEIFDKYSWVPQLRGALTEVHDTLRPVYHPDPARGNSREPDAEKRFETWRAATFALIKSKQGIAGAVESNKAMDDFVGRLASYALRIMEPSIDLTNGAFDDLKDILRSAIDLDRKIYDGRAGRDYWFLPSQNQIAYSPEIMSISPGKPSPQPGQRVVVVVAPALVKHGRDTGRELGCGDWLLKMNVSCEALPRAPSPVQ